MPQLFTSLHYHVVFSTMNRQPTIVAEIRNRLYEYIGGILARHKLAFDEKYFWD